MLWDIVKDPNLDIWENNCGCTLGDKVLDDTNLIYVNRSFKKYLLQAKESRIRLLLMSRNDCKFVSKFILQQTQDQIK